MKKILAFAAICIAGCLPLSAAGCSAKSRNLASLASNWYSDPDFKSIQPTFTFKEGDENFKSEKAVYSVKHSTPSENSSYTVEYAEGTYTTEFFAEKIPAEKLNSITAEEWRGDYENSLGSDGCLVLYCYRTSLEIPSVTYKFHEQSKSFENEYRRTLSYFLSVDNYLSPVYTLEEVKSTSPNKLQAKSLEKCYWELNRKYESFYTLSASEVKTVITDNLATENKESEYSLKGLASRNNSVFDTTYLDIIVRGMKNMSASLNQIVTLYRPGTNPADYTIAGSGAPLCENEEDAASQLSNIQSILAEHNLFAESTDEEGTPKKLETVAINVSYNDSVLSGVSQRYWFAVGDNNKAHTVMVKYSSPLAYGHGVLEYLLKSIESMPDV